LAIARISAASSTWSTVRLAVGGAADLRALLDYGEDLIEERSALSNPGPRRAGRASPRLPALHPNLTSRAQVHAALRLISGDDCIHADLCRRRLERMLTIDREAAQLKRQITDLVAATRIA
jgi:transposase